MDHCKQIETSLKKKMLFHINHFEPREYFILKWYFPASWALLSIVLSYVVAKLRRNTVIEKKSLIQNLWEWIVILVEAVLAYVIIDSVWYVPTDHKCQFLSMPTTSFLLFVSYLFTQLQILIEILNTRLFEKEEVFGRVRRIMPPWILIFQRIGYNWIVVLRNLIFNVLIGVFTKLNLMHLSHLAHKLSDVTVVVLFGMRIVSLYLFVTGDPVCSGVLPSFIADLLASSIPVVKILKGLAPERKIKEK
jgi:hypothetical protein